MGDNAIYDVGKFSSKIASSGLASPNKFEVVFTRIPVEVKGVDATTQLSIMCDQCSLAGRDVQAQLDLQYGIRRQVVYNAPAYTPLSLSFICTDNMNEKRILDVWNNKCVNTTGNFQVAYYDDYIGHLDVFVLDRSGKKRTYHMHYHEVYPKTVTAVELNHGTTNAALRVTAEIQYAYWSTGDIHAPGGTHY
ncbi:MAG: hypothetical protein HOC18_09935 [Candidatus Marinimicrobia bacterium]|nr:hypothetical protein [Candidatus Neomarinimicrobiota bacterium]